MRLLTKNVKVGYVLKVFPRLSETFVLNEILELERQGIEVEVFSLKPSAETRYHAKLAQLSAQVHYLQQRGLTATSWRKLQAQFESLDLDPKAAGEALRLALRSGELVHLLQALSLVVEIRKRGITHLHAHFATSATWVALLTHQLSGISFSFTAHAKDIYHEDAERFLLTEALKEAAYVVTVTDHNVQHLSEFLPMSANKIHRVYNGIRLSEERPLPALVSDQPLVLGVGRLVEKKGFRYLVEACRILKDRGRRFRCVIVGGGAERGHLNSLISEHGLQDIVTLEGPQSGSVVMDYMARSRMLVLPCVVATDGNRDALPTVMLEAMALGRPVVSTDLPGVTEIVDDGDTGLLVRQRDAESLAGAIEHILIDPQMGYRMGLQGRRKAEKLFSLEDNVETIAALIERCVAESPRQMASGRAGE